MTAAPLLVVEGLSKRFAMARSLMDVLRRRRAPVLQALTGVSFDVRRGETVKAVVVLKPQSQGRVSAEDIMVWARSHMAAYKVPRVVEFVDALPRSGTGKIQWRVLQERAWQHA